MLDMVLKERQKSILGAVIQEYVRTAEPVASRALVRKGRFGVGPATIRNEMHTLEEQGYLVQPHTSAGRVPTDRGYRFFVDYLVEETDLSLPMRRALERAFDVEDEELFMKKLGKTCAHLSGMFVAVGGDDDEGWYRAGFNEVLDEPEFDDFENLKAFVRLADTIDEEIVRTRREKDSFADARVLIGEENSWEDAREYSIACTPWRHPAGFGGVVALIGPTRMDYARAISLINYLYEYR